MSAGLGWLLGAHSRGATSVVADVADLSGVLVGSSSDSPPSSLPCSVPYSGRWSDCAFRNDAVRGTYRCRSEPPLAHDGRCYPSVILSVKSCRCRARPSADGRRPHQARRTSLQSSDSALAPERTYAGTALLQSLGNSRHILRAVLYFRIIASLDSD